MSTKVKIGLCVDDLRLPAPEAIQQAAKMGYHLIELGTVGTEFEPRRFGQTARRHLRRFVLNLGLEIAALAADIGGKRFADPARVEEGFDRTRAAMEMAAQMHVPIVVTDLGPIAAPVEDAPVFEVLQSLGQIADATGTFLALRTGYCEPRFLADLVSRLGCPMIRVCYDPGGLLIAGASAERPRSVPARSIWLPTSRTFTRPATSVRRLSAGCTPPSPWRNWQRPGSFWTPWSVERNPELASVAFSAARLNDLNQSRDREGAACFVRCEFLARRVCCAAHLD